MRTLDTLSWINRRGAPLATLALLCGFVALTHKVALGALRMTDTLFSATDHRYELRMRLITHIDAHVWLALSFVALFAATVLWLQMRRSPRWSLWLTFAALALPMFGYTWVCMTQIRRQNCVDASKMAGKRDFCPNGLQQSIIVRRRATHGSSGFCLWT
jgi:hypothetical protein